MAETPPLLTKYLSHCELECEQRPRPCPAPTRRGVKLPVSLLRRCELSAYPSVSLEKTEEDAEEVAVEVEAGGYRGGA